eukprot:GFKZ01014854.1.p2 GENE.GFKZ01014854.1~~GFKZ01014854.1.p2  ORF type:complete len:102 (+),score=11.27 GFKZ01014854.1:875-1180(+)
MQINPIVDVDAVVVQQYANGVYLEGRRAEMLASGACLRGFRIQTVSPTVNTLIPEENLGVIVWRFLKRNGSGGKNHSKYDVDANENHWTRAPLREYVPGFL